MYKQVVTSQELIGNGANKPVATLRDEYGGETQIIIDDGCYVLMNKIDDGEYMQTGHIYPEALEVLRHLPSPRFGI